MHLFAKIWLWSDTKEYSVKNADTDTFLITESSSWTFIILKMFLESSKILENLLQLTQSNNSSEEAKWVYVYLRKGQGNITQTGKQETDAFLGVQDLQDDI